MPTHCCRHKCFPVCPRAQHLLRTQILCPGHKNVSDFVQKHFVSATNVSLFAQPKKHHEQLCARNNVSSFASTFTLYAKSTKDKINPKRRNLLALLNGNAFYPLSHYPPDRKPSNNYYSGRNLLGVLAHLGWCCFFWMIAALNT